MKDNCNQKLKMYEDRFDYSNKSLPQILGNPNIYQQLDLIEDYIEDNNIFEIDKTIVCKAPLKVMTFIVHTPNDFHNNYYLVCWFINYIGYSFNFCSQSRFHGFFNGRHTGCTPFS